MLLICDCAITKYFKRGKKDCVILDKDMSLADELLADLEEDNANLNEENQDESMDTDQLSTKTSISNKNNVHAVAKLKDSVLLQETMRKIDYYTKHQRTSTTDIQGALEHDPEYLLIVDANNLLVEIDNEIEIIHNFVKNIYHQRFPELEQLVQLPLDYLKTVKVCFFLG